MRGSDRTLFAIGYYKRRPKRVALLLGCCPRREHRFGHWVFKRNGSSRLIAIATLLSYWLISGSILRHFSEVRDASRWLFQAKAYKTSVLALPAPPNGDFRHVEWEGWGFAGTGDTTVYLVVDPSDSLSEPAKNHLSGRFAGVSCAVYRIHRLEKHWYTVAFYTDTSWGQCE